MQKLKGLLKSKKFWITIGIIFVIGLIFDAGSSGAKVEIDGLKMNYEEFSMKVNELESEIKSKEEELSSISEKILEEESKLEGKENEVTEVLAMIDDRKSLDDELSSKAAELDGISQDIESKKKELEQLEGTIVQKKDEPIELLAGQYIVGIDFPANRYQATNVGRGSNFVVYSSSGSLLVNTILGDDFGDGDYVFFASDGDIVETHAKTKLIPVE